MGASTQAILFYGVTSQDDSDSAAEICRRLDLITDNEFSNGVTNFNDTLDQYLKSKGLAFGTHGASEYPIIYVYPREGEFNLVNPMRYFLEIDPSKLKPPSKKIIQALEEVADELGYWGPTWKLVSYFDV